MADPIINEPDSEPVDVAKIQVDIDGLKVQLDDLTTACEAHIDTVSQQTYGVQSAAAVALKADIINAQAECDRLKLLMSEVPETPEGIALITNVEAVAQNLQDQLAMLIPIP